VDALAVAEEEAESLGNSDQERVGVADKKEHLQIGARS
jgi:hypothetical protein